MEKLYHYQFIKSLLEPSSYCDLTRYLPLLTAKLVASLTPFSFSLCNEVLLLYNSMHLFLVFRLHRVINQLSASQMKNTQHILTVSVHLLEPTSHVQL